MPKMREIPAISVLPDGSELDGVVIPRYDQELRLTGSLRAERLTLVGPEILRGDDVNLHFSDPEEGAVTHIAMTSATMDQSRGMIEAHDSITMNSARFSSQGTALHLLFDAGKGFVSGPATTDLYSTPKTAMIQPPHRSRTMLATTSLGLAITTSAVVVHSRPEAVSPEELGALERDAATMATEFRDSARQMHLDVVATETLSQELGTEARAFLAEHVVADGETSPAPQTHEEPRPLEIEASSEDTRILCDDGFYFDAEAGILVYLGNVRVSDPRFSLDGVDELKVIFAKKPESAENQKNKKPQASDDENDETGKDSKKQGANFASNIGDPERVIATGKVVFKQRQTEDGKDPVEASGALFNYNIATGEIILSGGYPWVRQGGYYARALQPNLNLRIREDGSFVTEGNWDTGQNIRR